MGSRRQHEWKLSNQPLRRVMCGLKDVGCGEAEDGRGTAEDGKRRRVRMLHTFTGFGCIETTDTIIKKVTGKTKASMRTEMNTHGEWDRKDNARHDYIVVSKLQINIHIIHNYFKRLI